MLNCAWYSDILMTLTEDVAPDVRRTGRTRGVPAATLRPATLADVPALERLIAASARELCRDDYTAAQIDAAIGTAWGVDRELIRDETYFVVEADGAIVACGGWSKRRTLFGGDAQPGRQSEVLDPACDAARIRAFFVHPEWARRGLGVALLERCEAEARARGFTLGRAGGDAPGAAPLPGVRLHRRGARRVSAAGRPHHRVRADAKAPARFRWLSRAASRAVHEDARVLVRVREHLLVSRRDAGRGGRARRRASRVAWRPFLLGPIFQRQGWNDSPFNVYPVKGRYMWRDLERICAELGAAAAPAVAVPAHGLLAARVALPVPDEPWAGDFVRAVYRANFAEDRDIADADGGRVDPRGARASRRGVLDAAQSPETKAQLRAADRRGDRPRHLRRAELRRRRRALLGQRPARRRGRLGGGALSAARRRCGSRGAPARRASRRRPAGSGTTGSSSRGGGSGGGSGRAAPRSAPRRGRCGCRSSARAGRTGSAAGSRTRRPGRPRRSPPARATRPRASSPTSS